MLYDPIDPQVIPVVSYPQLNFFIVGIALQSVSRLKAFRIRSKVSDVVHDTRDEIVYE